MITDAQFAAWLDDSTAHRVTLFTVGVTSGGVATVRYLSNRAYSNAPAATPYQAIIKGGLKMTETVPLVAAASLSAGDIEVENINGERDSWLDDNWVNQPVAAVYGDVRWQPADFRPIFTGISADIDGTKGRDTLNLKLRDKLQRLNTPVSEAQMGGQAPNPETLRPIVLGEVHNITPKLKNPNTGEYEFNFGPSEDVIEVRTDGKPRDVTKNLAVGSFTFVEAVGLGAVTCSVQGVKPNGVYANTVAQLVKYLVTQCGKASMRFTDADLDLVSLAAFDAAHPQPVGLYIPERMNVLEACHLLADSIGAQLVMSREGLLRLVQLSFPESSDTEIRQSVQLDKSIQLVAQTEVVGSVRLGYCKNWTAQSTLQTSIPAEHKELFSMEWLSVTATDPAVIAAYRLEGEAPLEETCLLRANDALAEANRRLAIRKTKRKTYRFIGSPINMLLAVGQDAKLFSGRYELDGGKVGVVTSLAPNWSDYKVTVEVTV